ncbi:hypothetical protein CONPUDRAFT_168926 [Coniophora puteana RWD-64-598 SS2]|uniref:Uncharacterized protein n=1 Tax=Coniophora puteana (strain RWD-64-598) TaxID=741705 RepID=A0A5M3MBV6_CONPW|nr:uncharacterized protein CONPUDRAFT_168926 [Coniophora puteana RWD-64-598 SS2]EIW76374.1 hypothetical protein CONPUDRAFT_168926 [Coniophora puteana RWD-64-598 SS2]
MRLSFAAAAVALVFSNALTGVASPIGVPLSERGADLSKLTSTGGVLHARYDRDRFDRHRHHRHHRPHRYRPPFSQSTTTSQSSTTSSTQSSTSVAPVGTITPNDAVSDASLGSLGGLPMNVDTPQISRRLVSANLPAPIGKLQSRLAGVNLTDIHARAGSISISNITARAVHRARSLIGSIIARAPYTQEEEHGTQEISEKRMKSTHHRVADSRHPKHGHGHSGHESSRKGNGHVKSPGREQEPSAHDVFRGSRQGSEPGFWGEKYMKREATSEISMGPESAPPSLHQGFIKNADYGAITSSPAPVAAPAPAPAPADGNTKISA